MGIKYFRDFFCDEQNSDYSEIYPLYNKTDFLAKGHISGTFFSSPVSAFLPASRALPGAQNKK